MAARTIIAKGGLRMPPFRGMKEVGAMFKGTQKLPEGTPRTSGQAITGPLTSHTRRVRQQQILRRRGSGRSGPCSFNI